jgi:preprotein translocase subunit SecA
MNLLCTKDDFVDGKESKNEIKDILTERALSLWESKESLFGEEGAREVERVVLLRNVDEKWMDHLEAMDDLRGGIGLQSYAQRNPINEYIILLCSLAERSIKFMGLTSTIFT